MNAANLRQNKKEERKSVAVIAKMLAKCPASCFVHFVYARFVVAAAQHPNEGRPKRSIEYRVDDRIDRGRHVTEPQAHGDDAIGDVPVRKRSENNVQYEEWRPAQHKGEEDNAQDLRMVWRTRRS